MKGLLALLILLMSCSSVTEGENELIQSIPENISYKVRILAEGNSWVVGGEEMDVDLISDQGIGQWLDKETVIRNYFKINKTGKIDLGIRARNQSGESTILVRMGDVEKKLKTENVDFKDLYVGEFEIVEVGYIYVEIQGDDKSGTEFGEIEAFLLGGEIEVDDIVYVKDDFYWGRRGPSVHLTYELPDEKDVEWMYSEIEVEEGQDVLGSYFMANGFAEGYFGMQVNSPSERRILFSVWSPYNTQNPNDIPEEYKIQLLAKGQDVYTGEFGNEGSGGQSYWKYNWKAGYTYRFLLRGRPVGNNSTEYSAFFYAPEIGEWKLIAVFQRPFTNTYLSRCYSFLENFITKTGYIARQAKYKNQWVFDSQSQAYELTKAKFTADATARKGSRLDYDGGVLGDDFFMKNDGFFNAETPIDSWHERRANNVEPTLDFDVIEKLIP
ncbi:DUF3472 domain-containing protein [Membranihabitans marinus]|uniref:DUF3472 domain-containing protein n=1 Tax=Membranihabitans marinus TaxID=1227546 RepID=UPI001F20ACFB|nr:DUF3472 domain-containing protein [Membranihabitans marinus]